MPPKTNKSKEVKELIQKEKKLHKEIHSDSKEICSKTNEDIEFVKKSKLTK